MRAPVTDGTQEGAQELSQGVLRMIPSIYPRRTRAEASRELGPVWQGAGPRQLSPKVLSSVNGDWLQAVLRAQQIKEEVVKM